MLATVPPLSWGLLRSWLDELKPPLAILGAIAVGVSVTSLARRATGGGGGSGGGGGGEGGGGGGGGDSSHTGLVSSILSFKPSQSSPLYSVPAPQTSPRSTVAAGSLLSCWSTLGRAVQRRPSPGRVMQLILVKQTNTAFCPDRGNQLTHGWTV